LFFLPEGQTTPSRYKTTTLAEDSTDTAEPDILVHDPSAKGVVYDWQDEFYLPLAGFSSIWRPAPSLTLYVRPDLASKLAGAGATVSPRQP